MLIPLKPDEIPDHDLVIDVEIRRVLPDPDRSIDPTAGPRAYRRIRITVADWLARGPGDADRLLASIGEVVDTAIRGPSYD